MRGGLEYQWEDGLKGSLSSLVTAAKNRIMVVRRAIGGAGSKTANTSYDICHRKEYKHGKFIFDSSSPMSLRSSRICPVLLFLLCGYGTQRKAEQYLRSGLYRNVVRGPDLSISIVRDRFNWRNCEMNKDTVFIIGPSGSGKTTLADQFLDTHTVIHLDAYVSTDHEREEDLRFTRYLNKMIPCWRKCRTLKGLYYTFYSYELKKAIRNYDQPAVIEGIGLVDGWWTKDLDWFKDRNIIVLTDIYSRREGYDDWYEFIDSRVQQLMTEVLV